jgi:putative transposase
MTDKDQAQRPSVVLVVEGNVLLRLTTASVLRQAGFEVLEAANAAEAVVVLNIVVVDALISDMNTEERIIGMLPEHEAVAATGNLHRKHGVSKATFHKSKAKSGASEAKRRRSLEDENRRLKNLFAETMLNNAMLKNIASKK